MDKKKVKSLIEEYRAMVNPSDNKKDLSRLYASMRGEEKVKKIRDRSEFFALLVSVLIIAFTLAITLPFAVVTARNDKLPDNGDNYCDDDAYFAQGVSSVEEFNSSNGSSVFDLLSFLGEKRDIERLVRKEDNADVGLVICAINVDDCILMTRAYCLFEDNGINLPRFKFLQHEAVWNGITVKYTEDAQSTLLRYYFVELTMDGICYNIEVTSNNEMEISSFLDLIFVEK